MTSSFTPSNASPVRSTDALAAPSSSRTPQAPVHGIPGADPAVVRAKRAFGAMMYGIFGGLWLALTCLTSFDAPRYPLLAIGTLAAVLVGYAAWVYRKHASAALATPNAAERRAMRWFHGINAAQWMAIPMVANVLNSLGHRELVIPGVIMIVGLHFLPLARLFHYPPHRLTGAALIATAVLEPVILGANMNHPAGTAITGLVLWASALRALRAAVPAGPWSARRPRRS
jgi:hypothetical protein